MYLLGEVFLAGREGGKPGEHKKMIRKECNIELDSDFVILYNIKRFINSLK